MGLPPIADDGGDGWLSATMEEREVTLDEQSKHDAKEVAQEASRVIKLKLQQDMAVRKMKGLVVLSNSDSDSDCNDDQSSTPFGDDLDLPPLADAYSYAGDRKGKGSTRKW
ncbi:hypothetical protein D1007_46455 [Hordeum vulgare]|nr:hypothetical protein D1007_46455 [Hordeum vulgare]